MRGNPHLLLPIAIVCMVLLIAEVLPGIVEFVLCAVAVVSLAVSYVGLLAEDNPA